MKHTWILNEDGETDFWQMDVGFHNGPRCALCGWSGCAHCKNVDADESCDGGVAKAKREAEALAVLNAKRDALAWALLPPEEWDAYDETAAIKHRETLSQMLVALRQPDTQEGK